MTKKQDLRIIICFVSLSIIMGIFFLLSLINGSGHITLNEFIDVISGSGNITAEKIILEIRLPRAAAALMLGGALSVSGYLLQTFFSNPIAGPFVLGISSGAKLVVAAVMIYSIKSGIVISSFTLASAAFIGSLLAVSLILPMSGRVKGMAQLIIIGIMIGYICSAATELLVNFADDSNIVNLHNWSMGSFSGISNKDLITIASMSIPGTVAAFFLSKPMSAYLHGEGYAVSVGVNIKLFRVMLIILSSLLSACVTAFAGPVSFVGVAVPHIIKWLFKTSRPFVVIPASFIGGSVFCLFCDLIARMLFSPLELSISTVTAILGAPVVIIVMIKKKRNGE